MRGPDFSPSAILYPFKSRWFESSVGRIHYIDEGSPSGRPIVFFHGNPTWSFLYRNVITGLKGRFRCIAVDYPGFGLSDRPDEYGYTPAEHAGVMRELAASLELHDALIMGQDWGGPIGLSVAASISERVSGLILGNTFFWPNDRLMTTVFSKWMGGPLQRSIIEKNFFVERLIPIGTSREVPPEVMDHYRKAQPSSEMRVGVAEFPKQLLAAAPWLRELERDVDTKLSQKKTLFVWGMKDLAFPPKTMKRAGEHLPNHTVVELPKAKHFIQEDSPLQIVEAITKEFG